MAGEGEKPTSIRRRLTTSIKRVMSYKKHPVSPPAGSSGPAAGGSSSAPAPTPVTSAPPPPPPPPPAAAAAAAAAAAPAAAAPSASQPSEKPQHKPYRPPKVPTTTQPPPTMSPAERAQALFKKHGLDLKASDLPLPTTPRVERVQKDIRIRVHRTCHKCDAPYGADKTCLECGHKRCKKCPRHPVKKSKDKGKEKLTTKTAPGYKKRKGDIAYGITIPGRRGGQDLVRKQVRQRVHRKCHRCDTDFGSEKVCSTCKHNRCKKCPRHPNKSNKPPGYYDKFDQSDSEPEYPAPPRRTYKKPRRRIHWTCSNCSTTFIEKTRICATCGANRDDTGIRDPPKKPKFKPTDEDVQRLNDRLKQTSLTAA